MEKWLKEDKLECSEELGDFFRPINVTIALGVYVRSKAHMKAIACMIDTGQTSRISDYAQKVGLDINHIDLVNQVSRYNTQAALVLANSAKAANALVIASDKRKQDLKAVEQMINMFLSKGLLTEASNYALDNLLDTAEDGKLQTKILVALFMNLPRVAEQILAQDLWHFFDRQKVSIPRRLTMPTRPGRRVQHTLSFPFWSVEISDPEDVSFFRGRLTPGGCCPALLW